MFGRISVFARRMRSGRSRSGQGRGWGKSEDSTCAPLPPPSLLYCLFTPESQRESRVKLPILPGWLLQVGIYVTPSTKRVRDTHMLPLRQAGVQ